MSPNYSLLPLAFVSLISKPGSVNLTPVVHWAVSAQLCGVASWLAKTSAVAAAATQRKQRNPAQLRRN